MRAGLVVAVCRTQPLRSMLAVCRQAIGTRLLFFLYTHEKQAYIVLLADVRNVLPFKTPIGFNILREMSLYFVSLATAVNGNISGDLKS